MTQDVAQLGFSVDSSQVLKASQNLDSMRGSAENAGRANVTFALQVLQAQAAAASFREVTQALNQNLTETQSQLDGMLRKLDDTRQALRGSVDAMKDFSAVRMQVEAVGQAFGVTSSGLEAYYRQSMQLGFTTPQTVQSLQRITEALANQTQVGQQTRRIMQEYGVSLAGLGINDADKALARFTERMRTFQDTAQKFRTASAVLGPLDPDSFGRLNNPDYVPLEEQHRRHVQAGYSAQIADRTRNASIMDRETSRAREQYDDLSSVYNLGRGSFGGLTYQQRMDIRAKVGLSSDTSTGSMDDRLAMLQYLSKNPNSPEAMQATDPAEWMRRNGGADTGLNRWAKFMGSGQFSANNAEIDARFQQDRMRTGMFSATASHMGYALQNLFGFYEPMKPIADPRDAGPMDKFLTDQNVAAELYRFGDAGLMQRQRADELLPSFRVGGNNLPNNPASTDALAQFRGVYGSDEGHARFTQTRLRLERAKDNAMTSGAGQMDENAVQAFLLQLPREQRGAVEEYLRFNADKGDNGRLVRSGVGFDDLMRPGQETPGGLTPGQSASFVKVQDATRSNRMEQDKQAFEQQMDLQTKLTGVARDGASAMETLTARTNAYNQALAQKKTGAEADLAASRAQYDLDEKRRTQAEEMIGNMERENKYETDRIAMMRWAGQDPAARADAAATSAMRTEYERAAVNNPKLSWDQFMSQKRQEAGNRGTSAGDEIETKTRQELKQQQDLLGVANQRADVQARFASDQKVDLEFAQARGDLIASNNKQALAALDEQIARTKQLRNEIAALNQEAKNFKIGTDQAAANEYDRQTAATRDPQERRRRELLRGSYLENQAVAAPDNGQRYVQNSAAGGPSGGLGDPMSSGDPGTLEGRKRIAFNYFLSRGARPEEAAGRLGNMLVENPQLDPAARGDGGHALGIGQWHEDRQAQFKTMIGRPMAGSSYQEQLRFYYDDPDAIWNQHKGELAGTNADQAGRLISKWQERPGESPAIRVQEQIHRGQVSQQVLNEQMAGRPGWALRDQTTLEGDDAGAQKQVTNDRDAFNERQRVAERARRLAGSPGDAARERANTMDPNANPTLAANQRDQNIAEVRSGQLDQAAQTAATTKQAIEDNGRLAAATEVSRAAIAKETREQALNREERELGAGTIDRQLRSQQMLATSYNAVQTTMAEDRLKTKELTEDNDKLAAAWSKGAGAALQMQRALELAPIEREIASLKEQGVNVDALTAKYNRLVAAKTSSARSSQNSAIERSMSGSRDQNEMQQADNDLGWFATDRQRERTRSDKQAEQDLRNLYPDADASEKAAYTAQAKQNQALRETSEKLADVRDGFREMGDSAMSAFNNAMVNGGRFRDVVGSITKEWSGLLLKMAEKPLMNAAEEGFSSFLGWASKGLGFASGVPGAGGGAGGGAFDGAGVELSGPAAPGFAAGGAFYGGVRMFAAGGILDRPTRFYSAGGQANVAGEVGSEAIMPIRRMANGDMGVVSSGGGGKGVTVNAPITVNGGGGGGSSGGAPMDPQMVANMQAQLREAVRVAVVQGIADERRPGGSLY